MTSDKFKKRTAQMIARDLLTAKLPITYPLLHYRDGVTYTNQDRLVVFLMEYLKEKDTCNVMTDEKLIAEESGDTQRSAEMKDLLWRYIYIESGNSTDETKAIEDIIINEWEPRRKYPKLIEILKKIDAGDIENPTEKMRMMEFIADCANELRMHRETNMALIAVESDPDVRMSFGDIVVVLEAIRDDNTITPEDAKNMFEGQKYARTIGEKESIDVDAARQIYTCQSENLALEQAIGLLEELNRSLGHGQQKRI